MADRKGVAFFERGSWYHRIKLFQEDGTTKYSKKGLRLLKKQSRVITDMKRHTKKLTGLTMPHQPRILI